MDNKHSTNSLKPSETMKHTDQTPKSETQRSLVPKGITIGMAIFALVLSLAGYGFRLMVGDDVGTVLRHAAVIVCSCLFAAPRRAASRGIDLASQVARRAERRD